MIDINKANLNELTTIKGIGKTTAENIIKYREENNSFNELGELMNVQGIAEKTFKRLESEFMDINNNSNQNLFEIEVDTAQLPVEKPEEIHLVGDMNNWDTEDKSYCLNEKGNGIWTNEFDLEPGTEYKIMYDSTDWEENKHFGNNGANFIVK